MKDLNTMRVELYAVAQKAGLSAAEFNVLWANLLRALAH